MVKFRAPSSSGQVLKILLKSLKPHPIPGPMDKAQFEVFQKNLENVTRATGNLKLSMLDTGYLPRMWRALCVVGLQCLGL
ncbi:hypothetical protein H5410_015347 [Solanum commersonii]|uniref:Uncharacterized protein n=1 Tax=Solanum commersonii TaxID=4109 RepID=A0A9J5ZTU5_SOLCO|nr:hypothetical protein H5410_015347 [Solanum commersonii]